MCPETGQGESYGGRSRYKLDTRNDVTAFYRNMGIEVSVPAQSKYDAQGIRFELTENQKQAHYSPVLGVRPGTTLTEIEKLSTDANEPLRKEYQKLLYAHHNPDKQDIIYGPANVGFYPAKKTS